MTNLKPLAVLTACLALPGCALLGKNEPMVPRYFTPIDDGAPSAPAVTPRGDLALRLGRVEGWEHLRSRLAIRHSSQELTFSEAHRWSERPEVYLRRALSTALFQERGVVEVLSGRAATLDVELSAFEEVEQAPGRVRLQALLTLHDERRGLLKETVTVEQPVREGERAQAVAEAFGRVLRVASQQIADRVVVRLATLPPPVQAER